MSDSAARALRTVARVSGPAAVTIWTWLVFTPFAFTVMSGVQYVGGGPAVELGVLLLQHLALGASLLAGRALLRVTPERLRTPAVFVVFAGVGALRPLLMLAVGALLGVPVVPGDLAGRVWINVVVALTAFSITAIGVDLVHEHLGVYRRLRAAQRASALDAERAAGRVEALRHDTIEAVLAGIETAEAAAAHPIRPSEAARMLRGLASEVVRPASHRLYRDDADPATEPVADVTVRRGEWIRDVLGAMRAAPPLLLALLFAALVVPFGVLQLGPLASVPPILSGLAVVAAGNMVLTRSAEAVPERLRAVTLLGGYIAIGLLLALTTGLVVESLGRPSAVVWFEALTYPAVALAVALVASLSERLRLDQSRLESALQANVRSAARLRADYDHRRGTLARLLHAGVQSELIAAALALGADRRDDASADLRAVVDRVRDELVAPAAEPPAPDRIRALIDSWSSAIPLESRIADGVWDRLDEPARCDAVVEAISEGLANAVRHGDGTAVTLDVRSGDASGVEVVVTSGGALGSTDPGIGLRQLAERGDVELREAAGRVELAVAIP